VKISYISHFYLCREKLFL